MEKHERDILRKNRFLLIKNIILTEEFYDLLRSYHVLPETMIRDVQVRFDSLFGNLKARSHQRPDQPPLSPALEKWTDRQWAGLDRGERMLV